MKRLLSVIFLFLVFCSFGQKKRDSIPKHIHGVVLELAGAAGWNIASGYEYQYKSGLHSIGASTGIGAWFYRRNGGSGKAGITINQYLGVNYSVGTWVGLRTGINFSYRINPGAFTGYYNLVGQIAPYPLVGDEQYIVPGDPVMYSWLIPSIDIGPYFMLAKNRIYLYPKFSLGFVMTKSYWFKDNRYYVNWFPYGGLTLRFNLWKTPKDKIATI
jgi:hypothetical protein